MKFGELFTNKIFKWVVLYPRFRKFVNWAYSDLMKMPQYHIGLAPGQIGKYILLVDDPQDAKKVAGFLKNSEEMNYHREYRTFTGLLDGTRVSVTSIGLGGPPAAIGVHELSTIGAESFIYLGCGISAPDIVKTGDMIIAKGAVRNEGTGLQYAPLAFPAIADSFLTSCLRETCKENRAAYHIGLTNSTDVYYKIGSNTPTNLPYTLCSDLSTATIFITSSVLRKRTTALLQAVDRIEPVSKIQIQMGIKTIKRAIDLDQKIS